MTATPNAADLYLDLLKRSLTNSLFSVEPDANKKDELKFITGFIDHYIKAPAVSMLPLARFDNLQACVSQALKDGVPGDLIETGVWRGGSCIFMRAILMVYGDTERIVWAADSYQGLPKPEGRHPQDARDEHWKYQDVLGVSLEQVRSNFARYGMLDERVRFLEGWFKDTLPSAPIRQLAVLRLDGDMYSSTMDVLENLYDKVSAGGYTIVDDYGAVPACKQAVDDFRARRAISEPLKKIDWTGVFWQKPM